MNVGLSFVYARTRERLKPINHMLLNFCIGVIIGLSIKTVRSSDWPRAK